MTTVYDICFIVNIFLTSSNFRNMPNIKNVRKSVSNSPLMFANAKYAEKTANPTDADVLSIFFLFKIIRTKEIHNIIYSTSNPQLRA